MRRIEIDAIDKLEAENYTHEQDLNKANRKAVNIILKYIRTYPINENQYEVVRKKIIDLAEQEQKQNRDFKYSYVNNEREFCEKLIEKEIGIVVTHGNNLLNLGKLYYSVGILGVFVVFFKLGEIIIGNFTNIDIPKTGVRSEFGIIRLLQEAACSYIYIIAGKRAKKWRENQGVDLVRWGIILLFWEICVTLLYIFIDVNGIQIVTFGAIQMFFAILYIFEAKKSYM